MLLRVLVPLIILGVAFAQDPNRMPPGQPGPAGPPPPQFQRQPGTPGQPMAQPLRQPGRAGPPAAQQFPRQPAPNQQPMAAQQPDFEALRHYLNLSDGQLEKMRLVREQAARQADEKVKGLMPQIVDKRMALQDLLDKGSNDAAAVGNLAIELHGLEKQVREAHESVRNSQLDVLTPEQKLRFKAIEDAAALPAATRDAMRLGLVPGQPQGPRPMAPGQGPGMRQPQPAAPRPRSGPAGQGVPEPR